MKQYNHKAPSLYEALGLTFDQANKCQQKVAHYVLEIVDSATIYRSKIIEDIANSDMSEEEKLYTTITIGRQLGRMSMLMNITNTQSL